MNKEKSTFTITDHRVTKTYDESEREKMSAFYLRGAYECEGSEAERYLKIHMDLECGLKHCSDEYDD